MKKIVLIEDESLTVKILEFLLKKEGYDISVAKDGNQGMELYKATRPELVITDIMLPFKSGLEITAYIKEHDPNTPVIILSALGSEKQTLESSKRIGADAIIAKPFSKSEVLDKVHFFTQNARA
ncbi:response regulator transcription factor [Sediminicola luteus]|jgi:DNA-binding response OmpR family regulator|uniref:Response regulator n=1 Tax=Sediminicola luteus TaxID=319238 RepID=A0A2A4GB68_9FLAO|nr:response regulator [Sediminicola luteus]PCE65847.1 response regulator [Sediminicola luteus]